MSFELYFQNTYGPRKITANWIIYVLKYFVSKDHYILCICHGDNYYTKKRPEVYWLRHKDVKVRHQICCNVELNIMIFT